MTVTERTLRVGLEAEYREYLDQMSNADHLPILQRLIGAVFGQPVDTKDEK